MQKRAIFSLFLMISTTLRAVMIYHYSVMDKKMTAILYQNYSLFLVGEGGFGPPKSVTTDLQSAPFGRSGIPPYLIELPAFTGSSWSWWTDSNPRPADYKSAALPTELYRRLKQNTLIIATKASFVKHFFAFFAKEFPLMLSRNNIDFFLSND